MDVTESELRQRKPTDTMAKSESPGESGADEAANAATITDDSADTADTADTPDTAEHKPTVMQTKDEYFDALRLWLKQNQLQQMAYMCFPYYLSTTVLNSVPISPPTFAAASSQRFASFQQQPNAPSLIPAPRSAEHIRMNMQVLYNHSGYEYVIAPVWKRFFAEAIDVVILSIIKLMVVFMMIDLFNIQIVNLDFDTLKSSLEEDYLEFLSFSTNLLMVEILTKVLVCIYEALWTAQGFSAVGGATPGKRVMGIRILHVEAVVPIGQANGEANVFAPSQMRAIMYPAANPGFRRAMLRAIAKNMLMTLMFPMCFVLLFFRNNRTGYDVMTKTIVVEGQPIPVRRQ